MEYETTTARVFVALVISGCLGALLTTLWVWFGWTLLAPQVDMLIHWPVVFGWLSIFLGPATILLVGIVYWLPGLLVLGAPCWWFMHRRGYREWFHLATHGAVLVAIANYALSGPFGAFLGYHVLAMSVIGALVGLTMWRVAYRPQMVQQN